MSTEKFGSEIICQALVDEGVEHIFGLPGGVVIPTYDKFAEFPQLKHILVRHEQGATHMADGYARATGKTGVAFVTSGPGATNTVTGLLNAYMDSVPMVVITGQVAVGVIGTDAFQEADTVGITRPCTKHNYLVTDVRNLQRTIHEAFYIARTGKPGPVLIDIPKDVQTGKAVYDPNIVKEGVDLVGYRPKTKGHPQQIAKMAQVIKAAKKPVLLVGHGTILADATEQLTAIARKAQIPVTTTLLGLGAFPETDPLAMGMLGMHGTWCANKATDECDLVINIGSRFDDRITGNPAKFAPNSKTIHVDIDPTAIGKVIHTEYPVVGDIKEVLDELLPLIESGDTKAWLEEVEGWRREYPLPMPDVGDQLSQQQIVKKVSDLTKGEAIVVTDVGQHQMWAALFYKFTQAKQMITSGGLGTMGFGFPAAIGVQFAKPDADVWCFSGDGSFQMCIQEMAIAVQYKLPVKIALLNNGVLGMVRQWQDLFFNKNYAYTDLEIANPDFVKLAEAFGAVGLRASTEAELDDVLAQANAIKDKPVVLDLVVPRQNNVFPMIPAGLSVADMRYDR
jgi:acetolactate synthase I/II/III large subunit